MLDTDREAHKLLGIVVVCVFLYWRRKWEGVKVVRRIVNIHDCVKHIHTSLHSRQTIIVVIMEPRHSGTETIL